jgi:hypothetical protein
LLGSFLGAWVLFPLVLLALSTGCGLLVRRIAGGELSGPLLVPVGFALVIVICAFGTSYGWLAPAAGALAAVAAGAGFACEALARPLRLRPPRPGPWMWPLLAALVAFAAVGGPVFLTGRVGLTGYTRIVDLAFQLDFSQHLADAGRLMPARGDSSYNIVTSKLLGIGYPGGSQAALGAIAKLTAVNVAWCYQAFLAFTAAMGSLAVFSALRRVTRSGLMRFAGATVAIQPNLLYGYALEAGIKELTTATLLLLLVALLLERLPGEGWRRSAVPHAVATSAAFGAFSLGIAPWLGLLLAGAFVVSLLGAARRRQTLAGWGVFAGLATVLSIPGIITAAKLATVAGSAVGGVVNLGLGNLAAPVSRWSSAGVWLTGDYRYPLAHTTASHVFDVIVIALAVLGVLASLARRRWIFVVLGVTAPIALAYFIEHSTAWIQFKAFTITAAFALTLAFAGAASLQSSRRAWLSSLGWLGALAVAGGVLYGNALIYHDTTLAPGARYHDLAAIGARYSGQGPALDPYFDEYAEYFLRAAHGSTIVDPANLTFQVRPEVPTPAGTSFGWDLNQLVPSFLQSFPLIIQPRSPTATRAPSDYDLVQQTRFFDVWRQDRPRASVLAHFPLSSLPHERTPALCRVLDANARRAGPHALVAYALTSTAAVANPLLGRHPDYWKPLGPGALAAYGAGSAQMSFRLPSSGRFSVWLQGSVGRPLAVYIDGRRVSSVGYEERYPDQFLLLATFPLSAGTHELRLVRGGGDLHPGSGDAPIETATRTIGTIVVNREDALANRTYVAPATDMPKICAAPVGYEWLELLAPGGASPDALPARL